MLQKNYTKKMSKGEKDEKWRSRISTISWQSDWKCTWLDKRRHWSNCEERERLDQNKPCYFWTSLKIYFWITAYYFIHACKFRLVHSCFWEVKLYRQQSWLNRVHLKKIKKRNEMNKTIRSYFLEIASNS